jgi:hypothetical protein
MPPSATGTPLPPFWAILIIVLDVFVIWALAVHGREMAEL